MFTEESFEKAVHLSLRMNKATPKELEVIKENLRQATDNLNPDSKVFMIVLNSVERDGKLAIEQHVISRMGGLIMAASIIDAIQNPEDLDHKLWVKAMLLVQDSGAMEEANQTPEGQLMMLANKLSGMFPPEVLEKAHQNAQERATKQHVGDYKQRLSDEEKREAAYAEIAKEDEEASNDGA